MTEQKEGKNIHENVPEGIIIPPPEIAKAIEMTAGYVFRNGSAFEAKVREKEQSNPKFSFLFSNDEYFPFYDWRLAEYAKGNVSVKYTNKNGNSNTNNNGDGTSKDGNTDKSMEIDNLLFDLKLPPISNLDLNIIRRTALFCAHNGSKFLNSLSQREANNFQFGFLFPNHSLHSFFLTLVNQYMKVLLPSKEIRNRLENISKNKYFLYESALKRAKAIKYKEEHDEKLAIEAEKERIAYAQIDWHSFVVVETIEDFNNQDYESVKLPEPLRLTDLQYASLEQKHNISLSNKRIEEALPSETNLEPLLPSFIQKESKPTTINKNNNNKEKPQTQIRVNKLRTDREQKQICPRCQKAFPVSEFQAHLKIELIDPKWKEEKSKAEARQAFSNLDSSEAIANIKRLASARGDVFDNINQSQNQDQNSPVVDKIDQHTIYGTDTSEQARKRRAISAWDGYASSVEMAKLNAKEHETEAERKKRQNERYKKLNAIGPN